MKRWSWLSRLILWSLSLTLLLVLVMGAAISWGSADLGWEDVWRTVGTKLTGSEPVDPATEAIIWQIRLPRVILSALVGMALAGAGVVFQGLLRNPLADPYILGVSSGAALGAAIAIFTGAGAAWLGDGRCRSGLFSLLLSPSSSYWDWRDGMEQVDSDLGRCSDPGLFWSDVDLFNRDVFSGRVATDPVLDHGKRVRAGVAPHLCRASFSDFRTDLDLVDGAPIKPVFSGRAIRRSLGCFRPTDPDGVAVVRHADDGSCSRCLRYHWICGIDYSPYHAPDRGAGSSGVDPRSGSDRRPLPCRGGYCGPDGHGTPGTADRGGDRLRWGTVFRLAAEAQT